MAGKVESLPHISLHALAVPQQTEGPVAGLVVDLPTVSHPCGNTEALAQRPGGHVNEAESWGGVALQVGVNLPQVQQVLHGEEAGLGPGRVQDGSRVALGEDEAVVAGDL